jgi:hypothetical protein
MGEQVEVESVKFDCQRGQILVQVAIMVGVLFAFVALALDGGNIYAGRRRMQNAADAGALAGAREICFGDPALVTTTAREYAIDRNDAQSARVDVLDDYTVTVVASQTLDTFFAGVIGINVANVRGEAAAACGKVTTLCRVWPIAYDVISYTDFAAGTHFLLWDGSNETEATCDTYSCTCSPELGTAVPVLDSRMWVDFSAVMADGHDDPCDASGCGADELMYRVNGENNQGDECRSYIVLPSCAAPAVGNDGQAVSAWREATRLDPGTVVYIPLYDPNHGPCEIDDPGSACANERYWLTDVVCVEITGACRLCEKDANNLNNCNGPHVINAEVLEEDDQRCSSFCGTTFGGKPEAGDVKAVNLVPFPYP